VGGVAAAGMRVPIVGNERRRHRRFLGQVVITGDALFFARTRTQHQVQCVSINNQTVKWFVQCTRTRTHTRTRART
jgi:hypothetical protein